MTVQLLHNFVSYLNSNFSLNWYLSGCRIDFESVNLAGKLGGICDIDQLFILNSIDGPTSGQCGQLTGFSSMITDSFRKHFYIHKLVNAVTFLEQRFCSRQTEMCK